ncbi:MAG: hypothetical protein ACREQX_11475, partial [Candidatus Binataceae bacterium]
MTKRWFLVRLAFTAPRLIECSRGAILLIVTHLHRSQSLLLQTQLRRAHRAGAGVIRAVDV